MTERFEAAIVGGGPAGLSAGLVLGRARRRTIVFDGGSHRNDGARHVHGFLGLDDASPGELRGRGRAQLVRYPTVEVVDEAVVDAACAEDGFELERADGRRVHARVLLLATGLVDILPPFAGAAELVGDVLYPCPYCDGWELRDRPLAVYAPADAGGVAFALTVARYSRDLVFCPSSGRLDDAARARLRRREIRIEERPLVGLAKDGDGVALRFDDGGMTRRGLFFRLGARPRSDLAARLGCAFGPTDGVEVERICKTQVPNLFVAGDATRDVLLAVVAAGEGAAAGVLMNAALIAADELG